MLNINKLLTSSRLNVFFVLLFIMLSLLICFTIKYESGRKIFNNYESMVARDGKIDRKKLEAFLEKNLWV